MGERLSDTLIKHLTFPPDKAGHALLIKDSEVTGLGISITPGGSKTFVFAYRVNGHERRVTLGPFPAWSTVAARERAKELRRTVDSGEDPLGQRQEERAAPTVADMIDRYRSDYLTKKRPSSQRNDNDMIERFILPKLGAVRVKDIQPIDIDRLHREVSKDTPYLANRIASLLSRMFNLAIRWQWRPDNPVAGLERNSEEKRERYLTADELRRLDAALIASSAQQSADAVRLLLLTGARKQEVLSATADQFDLNAAVWTKPAATTKQARLHRVPLSPAALEVVRRRIEAAGKPYLFPGEVEGKPQGDIKTFWEALCRRAEIKGCRIHDLRHSYASILASAGLSLPTIGGLLGHTQVSTTSRYAHLADDALRRATETASQVISQAVTQPQEARPPQTPGRQPRPKP